jgi:hypothetical protein
MLTVVLVSTMAVVAFEGLSDIGSYSITNPGDPYHEASQGLLQNTADGIVLLFIAVGLAVVVLGGLAFIASISRPTRGSGR